MACHRATPEGQLLPQLQNWGEGKVRGVILGRSDAGRAKLQARPASG